MSAEDGPSWWLTSRTWGRMDHREIARSTRSRLVPTRHDAREEVEYNSPACGILPPRILRLGDHAFVSGGSPLFVDAVCRGGMDDEDSNSVYRWGVRHRAPGKCPGRSVGGQGWDQGAAPGKRV